METIMEHIPTNQGLDQMSHISADAWEQFFLMALDLAETARMRRATRLEAEASAQPETPRLPASPYTRDGA
jgi:hypothetical protein